MKCVVLAAGEGKRMHPLTYTRPKVMLPVANKPLLEWNLINAKNAGISDFVFIVAYKSEMVRDYFGDGSSWDVHIEHELLHGLLNLCVVQFVEPNERSEVCVEA